MDANPVKHGQRHKTFYVDTNRPLTTPTAPGISGVVQMVRCTVCQTKIRIINGTLEECPGCREEKKNV
jgi:hypothetical protein